MTEATFQVPRAWLNAVAWLKACEPTTRRIAQSLLGRSDASDAAKVTFDTIERHWNVTHARHVGKERRPHVHAIDTTGHTRNMLDTAAVSHPEIAPYVVVAGFAIQSFTAEWKLASVMAVAEAPRTARSSRPALRPTARSDHRSELLRPQSGCASDLATNPRRAHMRDKIVSANIASASVKSALHFLATLHLHRRTRSVA